MAASFRMSVKADPDELLPEADYGKLPFDLFMLEKWNNESPDNDATQRRFLCDYWVQLGSIVRKRYESSAAARVNIMRPTEEQIARIIAPLQTHRERNLSADLRRRKPPRAWLRTCYDVDTDAAHRTLHSRAGPQTLLARLGNEAAILDNAVLYDFGDGKWNQVFERVPALLSGQPDRGAIRRAKRDALHDAEDEADVYGDGTGSSEEVEGGPDWSYVQVVSKVGFLFIADREAMRTGQVLLAWYDDCGRLVKQVRVEPEKVREVLEGDRSGLLYDIDSGLWASAEAGPAYVRGGPCGPPPANADAVEYWESDEDAEIY